MGIRAQNGSDRVRTIWTPEMDRYFIDLMLEQVNKGNKIDDHLFSKRSWMHMMSLFNSKFKFQHNIDVLKNRHKSLRNLYRAIKKLLAERGFTWDETRQMVTADNNVWDEYIKGHPDARSYRIKSIPYYRDLCLIYGNAVAKLKGDNVPDSSSNSGENEKLAVTQPRIGGEGAVEASHEIKVDEDYGISTPKEAVDDVSEGMTIYTGSAKSTRSRTYWQPPMDRYFIDLMLDQVQKGNHVDGVFRKQAWMEMIASFNAKFGLDYEIDILKNRYKTLRRQFNILKNLLDLDGFSWDDTRQMVMADDSIWQDYIKSHTDARQFMTRPVPYYKDLCVICGDPSVDQGDCFSGQNEVQEAKFGIMSTYYQSPDPSFSSEDQLGDVQESGLVTNHKNKHKLGNSSDTKPTKRSRNNNCKKDAGNSNSIAVEIVIEAVQALPDMDEELVLDACDFLEDEKKAKTFIALDVKLRKKWLMRKLRPQLL